MTRMMANVRHGGKQLDLETWNALECGVAGCMKFPRFISLMWVH